MDLLFLFFAYLNLIFSPKILTIIFSPLFSSLAIGLPSLLLSNSLNCLHKIFQKAFQSLSPCCQPSPLTLLLFVFLKGNLSFSNLKEGKKKIHLALFSSLGRMLLYLCYGNPLFNGPRIAYCWTFLWHDYLDFIFKWNIYI